MRRRGSLAGRALVAFAACALLAPAAATAAPAKPGVRTTAAANVGQNSATLTGSVNPNERATTYFFEYGTTTLYGAQTPTRSLPAANSRRNVAEDIAGLSPATRYHYRLVAHNARGTTRGPDRTFRTQRQPLGLAVTATPNPVSPGGSTTIAGTLSGTGNANRQVVLQANPWPYTQGFVPVADTHLTNEQGGFAFPVLGITTTTQYRIVLPNNPNVEPVIAGVGVAPRVGASVKRVSRNRYRFRGKIRPAQDGTQIAIQKLRDGQWVTVSGTVARHSSSGASRYSKRVRLRRGGTFRVWVGSQGAYVPGASKNLRVRR
jgi:hypothetical protein